MLEQFTESYSFARSDTNNPQAQLFRDAEAGPLVRPPELVGEDAGAAAVFGPAAAGLPFGGVAAGGIGFGALPADAIVGGAAFPLGPAARLEHIAPVAAVVAAELVASAQQPAAAPVQPVGVQQQQQQPSPGIDEQL